MRFLGWVCWVGRLLYRGGERRSSWEEGVGVVWVGKRNNGYHNTGDMLNCRSFSVLMGTVVWSRCTKGGMYCEMVL